MAEHTLSDDLDAVDVHLDTTTVDVVEAIYGSRHYRYCNYVPEINPLTKLIYCRTCTCQIGSLWSEADYDEMRRRREETR